MLKSSTKDTFEKDISEGIVVVDFWATWCAPCRMVKPMLEELQSEFGSQISIIKVDADDNSELAYNNDVSSIPTIIIFKDGKEVDRIKGAVSKEAYRARIEENL